MMMRRRIQGIGGEREGRMKRERAREQEEKREGEEKRKEQFIA